MDTEIEIESAEFGDFIFEEESPNVVHEESSTDMESITVEDVDNVWMATADSVDGEVETAMSEYDPLALIEKMGDEERETYKAMQKNPTSYDIFISMCHPRLRRFSSELSPTLSKIFKNDPAIEQFCSYYTRTEEIDTSDIYVLAQVVFNTVDDVQKIKHAIAIYKMVQQLGVPGLELIKRQFRSELISAILYRFGNNESSPLKGDLIGKVHSILSGPVTLDTNKFEVVDFGSITQKDVLNEFGDPIPSSIPMINDCFSGGGWVKKQLVAVAGPPGTGKSLFLMQEASHFIKSNNKVLYLAIGDLGKSDFWSRISGILLNKPMEETSDPLQFNGLKTDLGEHFEDASKMDNLRLVFIEANKYYIDEIRDFAKAQHDAYGYNIVIVDYDANILSRNSDKSMYEQGGDIYGGLVNMAKYDGFDLVFVASQVKVENYGRPLLGLECLAESSKKQQHIDVLVTLGYDKTVKCEFNKLGYINLAKIRRGGVSRSIPYFRSKTGRFYALISQTVYDQIHDMSEAWVPYDNYPQRRINLLEKQRNDDEESGEVF